MLAAFFTHEGPTRTDNQDAVLLEGTVYIRTETPQIVEFEDGGVFAVADGVGGYYGGDIAAQAVLRAFSGYGIPGEEDPFERVKRLCREASEEMVILAGDDEELVNMSSTLAGVVIDAFNIGVFNCGDCRVYRFIEPYLTKLSHDHSAVQLMFDNGLIEESEMRTHPRKNVIMSGVGLDDGETDIFFRSIPFISPVKLFLCSDGVWEALPLEKIEEILCQPIQQAADMLVEAMFKEQAPDNISFIILDL
ncbi:MAG: serine/threonine-protein phosphatase [Deltaproteobacteria bacterium]|jgi:protein phosphatase|nr:serine/threonine-protein phosphatase [Deltaproteobacteria bacterium]